MTETNYKNWFQASMAWPPSDFYEKLICVERREDGARLDRLVLKRCNEAIKNSMLAADRRRVQDRRAIACWENEGGGILQVVD